MEERRLEGRRQGRWARRRRAPRWPVWPGSRCGRQGFRQKRQGRRQGRQGWRQGRRWREKRSARPDPRGLHDHQGGQGQEEEENCRGRRGGGIARHSLEMCTSCCSSLSSTRSMATFGIRQVVPFPRRWCIEQVEGNLSEYVSQSASVGYDLVLVFVFVCVCVRCVCVLVCVG